VSFFQYFVCLSGFFFVDINNTFMFSCHICCPDGRGSSGAVRIRLLTYSELNVNEFHTFVLTHFSFFCFLRVSFLSQEFLSSSVRPLCVRRSCCCCCCSVIVVKQHFLLPEILLFACDDALVVGEKRLVVVVDVVVIVVVVIVVDVGIVDVGIVVVVVDVLVVVVVVYAFSMYYGVVI